MANNIVNGNHMQRLDYANAGAAIASGDIVVVGATEDAVLAVALVDIATGGTGTVGVNCSVTAPKVVGAVFKQGESLNWDASADAFDDNQAIAAAGDVSGAASRADADGANGEVTCTVWLTGVPSAIA